MLQLICMLECFTKNKLRVYRELKEVYECKQFLIQSACAMGNKKIMFRFTSGTHGLNEEFPRHVTRNITKACVRVCQCDCE